jgi:hypothetical protein
MRIVICLLLTITGCGVSTMQKQIVDDDTKGTVTIFLGLDCPISQKYAALLNQYYSKYKESFTWKAFVPQNVSKDEIKQFRDEYGVLFPLKRDSNLNATEKYEATVTPEVIVTDMRGDIVYRGAIDNWFFELGKYRQQITESYLDSALVAVLNSRTPYKTATEPIGCFIEKRKTPR